MEPRPAYKQGRRGTLAKPPPKKPSPSPAPAPKPKTKGDASRSLMDDIMVGFTSLIKPKSSGRQAPVAAPHLHPTAPNVPSVNLAVTQTQPPLSHNVAGRQAGSPCTPPNHIGTRPEVVASRGSVIPSSRAPSSAPMDCEAKVPANGNQQPQQAGLPSTPSTHVGARAEIVASRGSVIPSSRAPSSAPTTNGEAKAPKKNHPTPSRAALGTAMDAGEYYTKRFSATSLQDTPERKPCDGTGLVIWALAHSCSALSKLPPRAPPNLPSPVLHPCRRPQPLAAPPSHPPAGPPTRIPSLQLPHSHLLRLWVKLKY